MTNLWKIKLEIYFVIARVIHFLILELLYHSPCVTHIWCYSSTNQLACPCTPLCPEVLTRSNRIESWTCSTCATSGRPPKPRLPWKPPRGTWATRTSTWDRRCRQQWGGCSRWGSGARNSSARGCHSRCRHLAPAKWGKPASTWKWHREAKTRAEAPCTWSWSFSGTFRRGSWKPAVRLPICLNLNKIWKGT